MRNLFLVAVALVNYTLAVNGEADIRPGQGNLQTGLAVRGIDPERKLVYRPAVRSTWKMIAT